MPTADCRLPTADCRQAGAAAFVESEERVRNEQYYAALDAVRS
ncbi:hypothetical protein [Streptomyces sp. NPDC047079]